MVKKFCLIYYNNLFVRIWSNLDDHAVRLTGSSPVILYAEISVGRAPVLDASVEAEIQVTCQFIKSFFACYYISF